MRTVPTVLAVAFLSCLAPQMIGCAADPGGTAATPSSEDEVVAGIRFDELSSSSELRAKVEEQDVVWHDENIMNGSVSVIARKVAPSALERLDRVGKAAFNERIRNEDVELDGRVTAKAGEGDVVKETARRIAVDGLVYADSAESVAPVETAVRALVDALGPAADVVSTVVEGRVFVDTAGDEADAWRASTFVFANKRTGEVLVFYAREGWI
ncbi:MAG TPA: hypothetical protein VM925_31660 [Labilithrix sp.]|nr:hypothetical protein [Labilithrix sp.]